MGGGRGGLDEEEGEGCRRRRGDGVLLVKERGEGGGRMEVKTQEGRMVKDGGLIGVGPTPLYLIFWTNFLFKLFIL